MASPQFTIAGCRPSTLDGQHDERQQLAALRAAVVIQDRLDALLPLAPLILERAPHPNLGAEIEQMRGRDPGIW